MGHTVSFDPAFVAANPIGRAPTLVTDDGIAIPESNWICDYLGSVSERPALIPPKASSVGARCAHSPWPTVHWRG